MARRALAVAVVIGCASPAPSRFDVYVTQTSGSAGTQYDLAASGSGLPFSISFPDSGDQMPSALSVGSAQLLAKAPACADTAGIGVGIAGVVKAVAGDLGGAAPGGPPMTTIVGGPAIVQASIGWSAPYGCDGSGSTPQLLNGTTTFTVFPSGRIVRTDEMVQGTMAEAMQGPCGCDNDDNIGSFELSTFWGFVVGSDVDGSDATPNDGDTAGCTKYPDLTLAVALNDTSTHHTTNDFSNYIRDYQSGGPSLGDTVFEPYTSSLQIAAAGACADTLPLLATVPLLLGSQSIVPDTTGIYDIDSPVDGTVELTSGSASILPGFAVQLDVGDHASIEIDGEPTAFGSQPGSNGTIIYIAAGLDPGDTLSVTRE